MNKPLPTAASNFTPPPFAYVVAAPYVAGGSEEPKCDAPPPPKKPNPVAALRKANILALAKRDETERKEQKDREDPAVRRTPREERKQVRYVQAPFAEDDEEENVGIGGRGWWPEGGSAGGGWSGSGSRG